MARNALEDQKYELIKAHILHPEDSPLPPDQQARLNRILSIARVLDTQPLERNAVAIHLKKYKDIKRTQAYEDCRMAKKLFNTIHNNDYDFWQTWLIEDIWRSIERCKRYKNVKAERVISVLYGNLIKALGEKPVIPLDPRLVEKNTFILTVNLNGIPTNVDLQKFLSLPENIRKKFSDSLISDIDDIEAEEIMNS
jgi:hypothetical protein